jgi:LuxR family maltose regulon positive regulatory protein
VLTTRYELLDRLTRSDGASVVVVSASAGSGKSVLLVQWEERDLRPHRTVRLAPWHDNPAALAQLLLDALDDLGPSTFEVRSVVTDAEPRFSGTLLPALAEVLATRDRSFVLVLDDVHLLSDPGCTSVLEVLCSHVPPGSQVALASRTATPEWLARTRAEGRLLELGPRDLAFDEDEVAAFVRDQGLELDAALVAELAERTEGWPVGLYLAARSLADGARLGEVPAGARGLGADRSIRDYLRTQVLAPLDDDQRAFLRRTSLFETVTADLCDTVLERDDSAAMLATLQRRLQLVVPLDRAGTAYRYHHLLGEALAADLAEHDGAVAPGLHARASAWCMRQGQIDEAIRHATGSGDLVLTGQLVFLCVPLAVGIGNPDRLVRWLGAIPESDVASERWLTLSACWLAIMLGDDTDGVTRWLLHAQQHAGTTWRADSATDEYAAHVAVVSMIAGRGGVEETVELAARAPRGLPQDSPFRAPALFMATLAAGISGHDKDAERYSEEGLQIARSFGIASAEAYLLSWRALAALRRGDAATAVDVADRIDQLVREHHLERLATTGLAMSVLAAVRASAGRLEDAAAALGTARRLSLLMRAITPWFSVLGPVLQARCLVHLGDHDGARLLLGEARGYLTDDLRRTWLVELADDTEALMRTVPAQGGTATALTAAEMRVLQFMPTHLTYPRVGEHLFLSANTVKTHALSIYRKLGVTSRDQAVVEARSLGLLESVPSL